MKSILVVIVVSFSTGAHGFQPVSFRQGSRRSLMALQATKDTSAVNWKRAKQCAENFGSCDVAEVEDLYKSK